jgi:hypothetical protein
LQTNLEDFDQMANTIKSEVILDDDEKTPLFARYEDLGTDKGKSTLQSIVAAPESGHMDVSLTFSNANEADVKSKIEALLGEEGQTFSYRQPGGSTKLIASTSMDAKDFSRMIASLATDKDLGGGANAYKILPADVAGQVIGHYSDFQNLSPEEQGLVTIKARDTKTDRVRDLGGSVKFDYIDEATIQIPGATVTQVREDVMPAARGPLLQTDLILADDQQQRAEGLANGLKEQGLKAHVIDDKTSGTTRVQVNVGADEALSALRAAAPDAMLPSVAEAISQRAKALHPKIEQGAAVGAVPGR